MLKKSQRKESRNIEMVDLNPQDGSDHYPESEDVPQVSTMYDFHDSTDTLKFWTEKRAINKTFFCFSSDFDETWWNCSKHG